MRLLASVLVLCCLSGVMLADDGKAARKALDEVFAADAKARARLLEGLAGKSLDAATAADARSHALGLQRKAPPSLPELALVHQGAREYLYEVTHKGTTYKNYALVDLPANLSPDKPSPLVIGLHSELGTAWYELSGLRAIRSAGAGALADCIVACPQALNRGNTADDPRGGTGKKEYFGWGPSRQGTDTVLNLIDGLLRDFNIDRDRIFLTGIGMGAEGCFHAAALRPSQFAAIGPRDGLPGHYLPDFRPNQADAIEALRAAGTLGAESAVFPSLGAYRQLPVHWVHADEDKKFPTAWAHQARDGMKAAGVAVSYYEYKGFHGSAQNEHVAGALKAALAEVRNPLPSAVAVRGVAHDAGNRASWLCLSKQSFPGRKTDWPLKAQSGGMATATLDRSENLLSLTLDGVEEVRVWLCEGLADYSKPLRIQVNGRERTAHELKHNLEVLARTASELRGTGEAYTTELTIRK